VSRDKFFLVIGASDPKFSETETRKLLESAGGTHIELVEDKDDALLPHLVDRGGAWRRRHCRPARTACRASRPSRSFPDMNRQFKLRP
jgi:hypothetical protein